MSDYIVFIIFIAIAIGVVSSIFIITGISVYILTKSTEDKSKNNIAIKIIQKPNLKISKEEDVLNISNEEIENIITYVTINPNDDKLLLTMIKICYTVYNNHDNDYYKRVKAAMILDKACSVMGYYSTKLLYEFIEDIKNLK